MPGKQGILRAGPVAQPQFGHGPAAGRIVDHAGIVEIAEVRGAHRGVLRAVDRPGVPVVHGLAEHTFPRAVFLREGRPLLRPGPFRIAAEGFAHEAAFQRPPASGGIAPVVFQDGPEIHLGTGETEQFPDLRFHGPAGEQELAEPDKALGDVAVGEELFEEVERGAVLPVGAEAVAQLDRVGEGALWGREIEEDPVHAVGLAVGGLEGVMELFPVAGAEPPVFGGGHVDVGEIGHDARGLHAFGQGGPGKRRARQAAAHDPQPRREAHQRLHRGGQAVVTGFELGLQPFRLRRFRAADTAHGELAPGSLAEAPQDVFHPRVGPRRGAQFQPGDALFVQQQFKGTQLQRREQVMRHFGVLFHQRGAPPHGQVVVGAEVFFQQFAVDPGAARFVGPCRQIVTDGEQAFVQLHGDGNLPVGDAAFVPYRHQCLGRRALRQFRFVQQDECSHRKPF